MKPAPFRYELARTFDHAVELLTELGEGARVLAGGQSLVPMMNLRLARPTALVDINRVPDADNMTQDADGLRVGALVRHSQLERSPADLGVFDVLRRAARLVGHFGIRDRGTIGGSIAHADPVAEWCLMAVLLDGQVVIQGPRERRMVPAEAFLTGAFTTALEDAEVVTEVRFRNGFTHAGIAEFSPRQGDFAVVAAATAVQLRAGICERVRVVVAGTGPVPVCVPEADKLLDGRAPSAVSLRAAADAAAEAADLHAVADEKDRRQLVGALVLDALEQAVSDAH